MGNTRTVRVVPFGGLGDVLLMTPSLRALKTKDPDSTLKVFCMRKEYYDLLKHNPHIDKLILVTGVGRWLRSSPIEFMHLLVENFFGHKSRRRFLVPDYSKLKPSLLGRSATETIGEMLGLNLTDRRLEVFLTPDEDSKAKLMVTDYCNPVVIQTTGRCFEGKNWPRKKWETLVQKHPEYTFIHLGLRSEEEVSGCVDLRGRTTLRESMGIVKYANCFVGVDSFLAHAASAVGTPGIVLFGPSSPDVWSHDNNVTITKRLRCSPCIDYLARAECPYGARCLGDISVEEVEMRLRQVMDGLNS